MKAIVQDRYGSPDVLELRDIGTPVAGDDEVLVRVRAAAVNPPDWAGVTGVPYIVRAVFGLRKPRTGVRGSDMAGVVAAVGKNVTRLHIGDEVFGAGVGAFAEFAVAPERNLVPKPANITFEQAAAVPMSMLTAFTGLRDLGRVQPGHKVLINGAGGGIGTFAVQIAKTLGAEVTGVCSITKVDLVRSIGADDVIDYHRDDFADGTRRYDLILDTAGRRSLHTLRRALAPRGALVIVGGEGGNRWSGGFGRQILRAPLLSLFVGQKFLPLNAKVVTEDLDVLRGFIESGKVTPVIDRTYPLAETPDAVRYVHESSPGGKVVVTVEGT